MTFHAEQVARDMVAWIQEYFEKNADEQTKAVVGISGGKDSSVVTAACVAALGHQRVLGVLMPNGEQHDIAYARELCALLEIPHTEVNIQEAVQGLFGAIQLPLNDVARFNTPARIRMAVLYAIAGAVGGRVANTCNLSEDYVGWATKFGDGAGDFGVLQYLLTDEVIAVGKALGLPEHFLAKTPEDGLCGQSDEEGLGFTYATLNAYIRTGICADEQTRLRIEMLHARSAHKLLPMPIFRPASK